MLRILLQVNAVQARKGRNPPRAMHNPAVSVGKEGLVSPSASGDREWNKFTL